jgi:hypothetical protein
MPDMPLLQIQASSAGAPPSSLLKSLSAELATELGKPEAYVMVSFETLPALLFAGTSEPACFAALKNIGTFSPQQTTKLSALLCKRLSEALGVAHDRIYIEFVNAQAHLWGHDGDTFA